MPRHRTGDEAGYRGRGHDYDWLTLSDWLRQKSDELRVKGCFLTDETRARLFIAEKLILAFVGSTADRVAYAWQKVSGALEGCPLLSVWETVSIVCLCKANESARDDTGLQPQRCGYAVCTIDEGPQALDIMAAGFTRLISADELVEGSVLCDDFVQQLIKVGRRQPCSLNAQMFTAHDIEQEPVMHMALSYKHADRWKRTGSIDQGTALQIAHSLRTYLTLTRRQYIRLWIDHISGNNLRGSETEWAAIGLLPYSSLRVMAIPNPVVIYVERPWLFYELLAAMMGQGVFVIRSQITTELNNILHVEELSDEAKEVFENNNIVVGAGYRSGTALNRAMMRLLTDHSVNTDEYLYRNEFSNYCTWAIRRIAWHNMFSIGWRITQRSVDNATLVEFVGQLCNPQFGQTYLGCKDPTVRGCQFGPRKRDGEICIEEIVNRIPSLLSQGTKLCDHFKVEEAHWLTNGNSSRRMLRISVWGEENVMYLEVRDGLIRLSEPPVQHHCHFQVTNRSQMMHSLEERIKGNFGRLIRDSEDTLSTRKLRTMQELARRVNIMHISDSIQLLDHLTNAAQADKAAMIVECSRRLREFVDSDRGSRITVDTTHTLRNLLLNDAKMTDEEITEIVNHLGGTVSFDNLRDKFDVICWDVANRNNAKQVLEICSDPEGRTLMIKATDLPGETVRRRFFQLSVRSIINAVPFAFVELDSCMDEDDLTALAAVYGARSARSVRQVSGNLYSRIAGYGNGKPSARLPVEIITGGENVGLRQCSCSVSGPRQCQHITESHLQPWTVCRYPRIQHNFHVRSSLARFVDESACSCEGLE